MKGIKVGDYYLGKEDGLFLIGGPCLIEDRGTFMLDIAREIRDLCRKLSIPFIFKSSYEKANRSHIDSETGPGIERGLEILAQVKEELGVPILCDVHSEAEVEKASKVADILQIPAFLCRQTRLILAVAKSQRVVNVKKGQFLSPEGMKNIVEKIQSTGNDSILLTERGSCFGYHNLVVDMRSFPIMAELGYPVVFDGTHSVQLPSSGKETGGERKFIRPLVKAATAAGIDGLFLEIHPRPELAPCDSSNMLPLAELESLLRTALAIKEAIKLS